VSKLHEKTPPEKRNGREKVSPISEQWLRRLKGKPEKRTLQSKNKR